MSGLKNCRECITELSCEKADRCFEASSASGPSKPTAPLGSLSCDAVVSCAPAVVQAENEYRIAFAAWLNADPRNAQANKFWKGKVGSAAQKLRDAKRTANDRDVQRAPLSGESKS